MTVRDLHEIGDWDSSTNGRCLLRARLGKRAAVPHNMLRKLEGSIVKDRWTWRCSERARRIGFTQVGPALAVDTATVRGVTSRRESRAG